MPGNALGLTITGLADAQNGTRPSGTFQKASGWPDWAQANQSGDLDLTGAPVQAGQNPRGVSISFTIDNGLIGTDGAQLQFGSDSFVPPPGHESDFTITAPTGSNQSQTLTITDENAEGRFTQLEYMLKFSDGTTLDPRMINR